MTIYKNTPYLKICNKETTMQKFPNWVIRKPVKSWNFQYLIAKLINDMLHIIIYTKPLRHVFP